MPLAAQESPDVRLGTFWVQVSDGSQIVILEARKKVGLRLARALQSQGQAKSYILQVAACGQPCCLLARLSQG